MMRMSLTSLSIDRDLCRCCLVEGSFADLAQPYLHNGREEIYSDMIKDTLDIEIRPVPGQLCVVTYKICDNCIRKLREACLFKERVLESEAKFKELYEKSLQDINFFKLHKVKVEEEDEDDIIINSTSEIKDKLPVLNSFDDVDDNCSKKLEDEIEELANQREPGSSPIHSSDDAAFDMKVEDTDDESELSIADLRAKNKPKISQRNIAPKAKTAQKTKQKEKKKVAKKRVKTENKKEEVAEGSEPKKKSGADTEAEDYTHTTNEDGTECYVCNFCESIFKRKDSMKQHINHVHLKQRPKVISCFLCTEKVPGHKRAFHLETVHGVPAPTCNACGKKFAFPYLVQQHQLTFHMGEKTYVCDICDKSFAARKNLSQHLMKHSLDRKFKCELCNETFKMRKHLTQHFRVHIKRMEME